MDQRTTDHLGKIIEDDDKEIARIKQHIYELQQRIEFLSQRRRYTEDLVCMLSLQKEYDLFPQIFVINDDGFVEEPTNNAENNEEGNG
jgi:hypothetical protein